METPKFFNIEYFGRNLKGLNLKYTLDRLKPTPSKKPFDYLNFFNCSPCFATMLFCPFKITSNSLIVTTTSLGSLAFLTVSHFFPSVLMSESRGSSLKLSGNFFFWLPFVMFHSYDKKNSSVSIFWSVIVKHSKP